MSCDACQLLSRPSGTDEAELLPALRRAAGIPPPRFHREDLGARHRRRRSATSRPTLLPVLSTTTLGASEGDTILGGVAFLYTSGSWPLALIVLIASVMIPLGKLVALVYLLITVQRGSINSNHERTRLYRMVELIGRWSMLDVFVDTFTVAMVQLQPLMSVAPGPGVLFFAAVVVLTMLAAETFDPRLIWDSAEPAATRAMAERTRPRQPAAGDRRAQEALALLRRVDYPDPRGGWWPSASRCSGSSAKDRSSPSCSNRPAASRPGRRSSSTRTCGSASCRPCSSPRTTPRCW